jgi:hypothetical protein
VTAEVVGLKSVPSALNLMWLVILLPCTFSQPIGMQLIEATGSYLPTQIWTGLMYIVAALCLCIVRGWKMIDNAKQKEATESSGEDVTAPADSSGGTEPVMEATLGQNQHHRKKNMMVECWKWRKV